MKCSVCKTCSPHLTKVEKKLFCDQCKPPPIEHKIEGAPIKQEIDPESDDISDSTRYSFQKKLKREIDFDFEGHSLDESYSSMGIDDNAGTSNSSWSVSIAIAAKSRKKSTIANKSRKAKQHKCNLCDYRYNSISAIRRHFRKVHAEFDSMRCKICYGTFKGESNLDKHIEEEHDGFGAKCKYCLEKLIRSQQAKHQDLCEGRHLFSCGPCGKRYVKLESLRKHLDEHGVVEAKKNLSTIKTRTRERLFICVICEDDLVQEEELYWKHVEEDHDGHFLQCDDCGKTSNDLKIHTNHRGVCKGRPARGRLIAQELLCPHCSKLCKNRASLVSHIYKNHQKTAISCNECGMKFQTVGAHRYHRDTIHLEPKFECSQCPRKFYSITKFKLHMLTHERSPVQCKICNITFDSQLELSCHNEAKHRPKNTFQCKQCTRRFTMRSHYITHMWKKHGHNV